MASKSAQAPTRCHAKFAPMLQVASTFGWKSRAFNYQKIHLLAHFGVWTCVGMVRNWCQKHFQESYRRDSIIKEVTTLQKSRDYGSKMLGALRHIFVVIDPDTWDCALSTAAYTSTFCVGNSKVGFFVCCKLADCVRAYEYGLGAKKNDEKGCLCNEIWQFLWYIFD